MGPVRIFVSACLGTLFATKTGHSLLEGDGDVEEVAGRVGERRAFLAAWIALQRFVLPRLGVST